MNTTTKITCHTASLYHMYKEDYESTLDDRIHVCLDAGCDGVEISNGPRGILLWTPARDTVQRLADKTVTVHAELNNPTGYTLEKLMEKLYSLPFNIINVTFHPDELTANDVVALGNAALPVSIENMDRTRNNWRTIDEVKSVMPRGSGFTFDTAHSMEHGLGNDHFTELFVPRETHLSVSTSDFGHHATHKFTDFPYVPSGCPIVVIEGVVLSASELKDEVTYIKENLKGHST